MPGKVWNDGSEAWQEYAVQLLKLHYGPTEFVEIPDRHSGDCGIEGFSRNGHAYQCYAAEEPAPTDVLLKYQCAKITKDIVKLSLNRVELAAMLGQTVLSRWILMVPRWESRHLVEHAEKKAAEVRNAGLPFVSHDFAVQILTEDDFAIEAQSLVDAGRRVVRIDVQPVGPTQLTLWPRQNNQLVANLDRKVGMLPLSDQERERLKTELIKHYLDGQNLLQNLRDNYPPIFVRARQEKNDYERFLETLTLTGTSASSETISSQQLAFRSRLSGGVRGISDFNVDQLVWEAIADWLLRCPLEIPGGNPQ